MPASDEEVEETLAENIAINNGWGPKEFLKDKNGKVTGVVFKKCLSVFDASGKFAPKYDENDTMEVEADYVITSIGQCIDWGGLLEGENMEFVHGNYPKADPFTYQTSVPRSPIRLPYPTSSSAATSTTVRPSSSTPSVKAMRPQSPCTASSARPAAP